MENNICYVTAFLDIGRGEWNNFKRTVDVYINSFYNLLRLFKNDNHLIVFIDDRYYKKIISYCLENDLLFNNVDFIQINEKFLETNFEIWKKWKREKEIMESKEYIELIKHKIHCPEHNNYKYTLINHSKIEFVNLGIKLRKNFEYFGWIDFGFLSESDRIPSKLPTLKELKELKELKLNNKVIYPLLNYITYNDENPIYTLVNAPEKVCGTFFISKKENLVSYKNQYISIHSLLQEKGIVDDDQHIVIQCYFNNPRLISFYKINKWKDILLFFQ